MLDQTTLDQAQQLLIQSEPEQCVALLQAAFNNNGNSDSAAASIIDVQGMHLLGNALLDLGEAQQAYPVFLQCANIDPTGTVGGFDKFLWLGQLTGGTDGVEWYSKGVQGIEIELARIASSSNGSPDSVLQLALKRKIAEALCGIIEIYMTDLCMEPEAESMCEKYIGQAILIDDSFPENWNVLGSIRISQQRDDEARQALEKSWALYQDVIEGTNNNNNNNNNSDSVDTLDVEEAVPSLIRLAQSMVELQMFEDVVDVTALLSRIDDQIADAFYLNGLAHAELAQALASSDLSKSESHKRRALRALNTLATTNGADPEMVQAGAELMNTLGSVDTSYESDSEQEELHELGFDQDN